MNNIQDGWVDKVWEALKGGWQGGGGGAAKHVRRQAQDGKPLKQNIYGTTDVKLYEKEWRVSHVWLKYRLVLPVLAMMEHWAGKYKRPELQWDSPLYPRLVRFDMAFYRMNRKWFKFYMYAGSKNKHSTQEIDQEISTNQPIGRMRAMKGWLYTFFWKSPFLREWFHTFLEKLEDQLAVTLKPKPLTDDQKAMGAHFGIHQHTIYNASSVDDSGFFEYFEKITFDKEFANPRPAAPPGKLPKLPVLGPLLLKRRTWLVVLAPGVWLVHRLMRKRLVTDYSKPYHYLVRAFAASFDAMEDSLMQRTMNRLRDLFLTLVCRDQAYCEALNCLLLEYAMLSNCVDGLDDVAYFTIIKQMRFEYGVGQYDDVEGK